MDQRQLGGIVPANVRLSRNQSWGAVIVVLLALSLVACGTPGGSPATGSAGPSTRPDALKVVTTTTVFADLVQNVGGLRVAATSILPPGVGPEDYEPRPDDAKTLTDASLVVSNGLGLDDFMDDVLASGTGGQVPHVVLGEGVPALAVNGETNPHLWLDPTLVKQYYLPKIAAALTEIDPEGKATYDTNVASYGARLDTLDAELTAEIATIPEANRKLVTFHDAFPYFARHYGFELVGVILDNPGQEPSASDLAALVETVRATGVKAVFSEAQFNPKLAETLAQEAGIQNVVTSLYTDALGPAPADTYAGLMRWDIDQIVPALR